MAIANPAKFVVYKGYRFCLDERKGYYISSQFNPPKALHRFVWENERGEIPKGYDIHHKDFDKFNNTIENLACIPRAEHKAIHAQHPSQKQIEYQQSENRKEKFLDAARKWHRSKEGIEWHRAHAKDCREKGWGTATVEVTCLVCGKEFKGTQQSKFCCNAHKSKWRRMQNLDTIMKKCKVCGTPFRTSKFKKRDYCDACKGLSIQRKAQARYRANGQIKVAICAKCHKEFETTSKRPWICPECHKNYR